MSFLSTSYIFLHLFKKDDNISVSVYNSVLIVMLVSCSGFPVLSWIDSPKFVQYLHNWEQFQVGNISSSYDSVSIENDSFFYLFYFSNMRTDIRKETYIKQVLNFIRVYKSLKLKYIMLKKFLLGFRVPYILQIS
jgi:hypothetical protein